MKITILGTSSGGPFHGRHYTSQFVQVGKHSFLIDCGEGTQMQVFKYKIKADRCNQLFISHMHGDHVFGLMGLITNWSLKRRTDPLQLFSPPGLQELIETTMRVCGVRLTYTLEFHAVDATVSAKVFENNAVEVWTIPLNHRTPTSGWLFREKPKPRNIRAEMLQEYGIAGDYAQIKAIKAGADLVLPDGRTIPNSELTFDSLPLSYAFCSDTTPSEQVAELVRGVDLLYHEATFTDENIAEAAFTRHSTARQAAEIAKKAAVKRMIIGHFSGRYADAEQHLKEAREVFPNTELAEEGFCWDAGKSEAPEDLSDLKASQLQSTTNKIMEPSNLIRTSKFLSQILRHRPDKIGLKLDENGWADVAELLEKSAPKGMYISREFLQTVVENNDKKRFALSHDGLRIRASQGHSINIDLGLEAQAPPETLFHGTALSAIKDIERVGLLPMRRQHVHLSLDIKTAKKVGGRHGKATVLIIKSGDMARAGHKFYLSDNGVWLTEVVPVEYIGFE